MPFLLIVRSAAAEILRVIHPPLSGTKNLFTCRLGLKRLFVFRFENDTLWPTMGFFPVISQILDMARITNNYNVYLFAGRKYTIIIEIQNKAKRGIGQETKDKGRRIGGRRQEAQAVKKIKNSMLNALQQSF